MSTSEEEIAKAGPDPGPKPPKPFKVEITGIIGRPTQFEDRAPSSLPRILQEMHYMGLRDISVQSDLPVPALGEPAEE